MKIDLSHNLNLTFIITKLNETCEELVKCFLDYNIPNNFCILISEDDNQSKIYKESELINKFKNNYKKIYSGKKLLSKNRLYALENCNTKWCYFVDADDCLDLYGLSKFLNDFNEIVKNNKDFYYLVNYLCIKKNYSVYNYKGYLTMWNIIWNVDFIKKYMVTTWNGNLEEVPTWINIFLNSNPDYGILYDYYMYIKYQSNNNMSLGKNYLDYFYKYCNENISINDYMKIVNILNKSNFLLSDFKYDLNNKLIDKYSETNYLLNKIYSDKIKKD